MDLEQRPNGDSWSILFQLIDERSGVTDVIKVKSHLEDVGPSVITQHKIGFHHMLANSMADVVAEEAAKRLLPDMNLERKANNAERIGVSVAKRLRQCKRTPGPNAAKQAMSLNLTLEANTRSAFGRLVDELAPRGLEMQSLQRVPCRQTVQFLEQNALCPSCAADVMSGTMKDLLQTLSAGQVEKDGPMEGG